MDYDYDTRNVLSLLFPTLLALALSAGCQGSKQTDAGTAATPTVAAGAPSTGGATPPLAPPPPAGANAAGMAGTVPTPPAAGRNSTPPPPLDAGMTKPPTPPEAGLDASSPPAGSTACAPRPTAGSAAVHFHHVHFNTVDPKADLEFFEKYFGAKAEDFCTPEDASLPPTRATRTERGYFLYTKVATPPDGTLNTYLEHVGWIHQDPAAELERLVGLGAPRFPAGRAQCNTAFEGTAPCAAYWFYLLAPSGARIEVARGPGPARMGFGHVHLIMGDDYDFYDKATNGALRNQVIDMVNHTNAGLIEGILSGETVVETRGKPIDHVGYSTLDLDAEKARVLAAGLTLAEDISFKPEYGFRSFFMKSPKGIWIELVEDSPFTPSPSP